MNCNVGIPQPVSLTVLYRLAHLHTDKHNLDSPMKQTKSVLSLKCRGSIAFLIPVCSPPLRNPIFIHLSVRVQVAFPNLKRAKFTTNPATVKAPTGFGEQMQSVQQGQSEAQLMPTGRYIHAQIAQRATRNEQPAQGHAQGRNGQLSRHINLFEPAALVLKPICTGGLR